MSLVDRYRFHVLRVMIVLWWVFSSSDLADILICGWYFVIFSFLMFDVLLCDFFSNTSVPLAKALEVFDRFGAGVWYIEMYRASYIKWCNHMKMEWVCGRACQWTLGSESVRWLACTCRYWEMLEGIRVSFQYQYAVDDIF